MPPAYSTDSRHFDEYMQDRLAAAGLKRNGKGGYDRIDPEQPPPVGPTVHLRRALGGAVDLSLSKEVT